MPLATYILIYYINVHTPFTVHSFSFSSRACIVDFGGEKITQLDIKIYQKLEDFSEHQGNILLSEIYISARTLPELHT